MQESITQRTAGCIFSNQIGESSLKAEINHGQDVTMFQSRKELRLLRKLHVLRRCHIGMKKLHSRNTPSQMDMFRFIDAPKCTTVDKRENMIIANFFPNPWVLYHLLPASPFLSIDLSILR